MPSIQREFVWGTEQIETLFDSLMRDYPIGTFLFWKIDKNKTNDFKFYEFLDKFHEKNSRHTKKATLSSDTDVIALLDGQQRLTSLYLALYGSYAEKRKHGRKNDMSAYPEKHLYLNLLAKADDPEMEYDFRFLSTEDAVNNTGKFWFKCSEIINFSKPADTQKFLVKNRLMDTSIYSSEQCDFAIDTLSSFFYVVHDKGTISYYLEQGEELDKVLQIFIRINSGGTKLSYSDLLLSVATAKWQDKDAKEVINDFVNEINNIGDGFKFNKDIVLKSCLVLSEIKDIKFKVDNFTKENMAEIERKWDGIAASLRATIYLIAKFGYNSENLLATNAVIPIAYFVHKNNFDKQILDSSSREKDRKAIQEWLARVLLKGVFGGQPDSIYPVMRTLINDNLGKFPLHEIIEKYKGDRKNILFTEDEIDGLLDLQYGKEKTYCALTLLYPSLNYSSKYHQDHIHPKSLFTKEKLRQFGVSESDIDHCLQQVNDLANLQLLGATQNTEKNATPFEEWLANSYPDRIERNNFLSLHHIKSDQNLNMATFIDFINQRRNDLKMRFLEILGKTKT